MKLSIALTTNLACYAAVIEPSESTIRDRTIRRRETWSQNQDRKFCIQMTSSPDEDLCEHPQGDRFDWAGGPISIHQNGKIVGLMLPETEKYKLCLDYDEVDIENDVFEFAKTTNDGVCITSLIIDGTDILVGPNVEQPNFWPGFWPNGKQPNFWIDGNENSCTADFVSTQELKIQNNVVFSSECDKFCIKMTSSPDQLLCEHPKADHAAWAGDAISIKQNGYVIGSMESGTRDFELCLDYDDVDIENDVFEFARTTTDGVCITSLSIDGADVLVGPNNEQPNFWIDGDDNSCTDDFVSTQELIIQNNAVISSHCDKICIKMTSSPDEYLCEHPKADHAAWAGGAISIKQNGQVIGSMKSGTRDFELCLDNEDVDIENDFFEFARTTTDGVCITSLSIDGTDILVGPNNNQPNFWFDGDDNMCTDDFVSTQELIIQNNAVIFSQCPPKLYYE